MHRTKLKDLHESFLESSLFGRYIHHDLIAPLLHKLSSKIEVEEVGRSVNDLPIFTMTIGKGDTKILMWSQMHGNESTTTKAIFDLLNFILSDLSSNGLIVHNCKIKIVPILNPDGAKMYMRVNANNVDLNRDAQNLSQPESQILHNIFYGFRPDYCFNLHGQRTIFSAGPSKYPATVSFLAPSQDVDRSITENRKVAMRIITKMNDHLQQEIPNQIGIYDDAFNLNCVGDTFQSSRVPTVLFEAGHFHGDYQREKSRRFIFEALVVALDFISSGINEDVDFTAYNDIPRNEKKFYDVIIRNTNALDIAIQFQEKLTGNTIEFMPKVEKISNLDSYFSHKSINASGYKVFGPRNEEISEGNEIDFVIINNERFVLKP